MCINPSEFEDLRQRFEVLEKDYGRLCQNDSVMRKELSIAFKRLDKQDEEINILKGILNNICTSIREDKEKINSLMLQKDMDEKTIESWTKWIEVNVNKFERSNILTKEELYNQMKVTQLDPVESEYYRQVDKAIKEQTLSDLYPTMHCATGTCSGCDEIYLENGVGDLFKYTCKKKNITIVANTTPKPENFWKADMNSEE